MAEKKYYVVWKGRETGIFHSWQMCLKHVQGFPGAIYKSFKTLPKAEEAFQKPPQEFIGKNNFKSDLTEIQKKKIGKPILESISVDGAWNTASGLVEYQGVYTKTEEIIFRQGPYEDGTNNIVEFLAIVHALAYCKQKDLNFPIYSDSKTAIIWVRKKEARTQHIKNEKNKKLFELLDRAVKWLKMNTYSNNILKWETKAWGEIPADFGRK
jgi:ribonuclease HI